MWQWYPSLNRTVLQLSDDMVVRFCAEANLPISTDADIQAEVPYPGIALFQKKPAGRHKHISLQETPNASWDGTTTPQYVQVSTPHPSPPSKSCNCKNIWSTLVTQNFTFQDGVYRYLEFPTAFKLNCTTPTTLLWLQAFFNSTKSAFQAISMLLTAF
jgi:hypothetical protein